MRKPKTSQVGSIARNPHEGSRSEYLAQYIFASFGTAVAVPHHEDHGGDFYNTLTESNGQRAWAKASYTVQVKSGLTPWCLESKASVEWLIKHPLPLFLGVVDKKTGTLRIYNTAPRFYTWALGELPDRLEMIPTAETVGQSAQWCGEYKFSLVPILAIEIARLGDDEYWKNARDVLEFWIDIENDNLTRIRSSVYGWQMPDKYETNALPRSGRSLWLSRPSGEMLNNGIRHLSECLECIGSQFYMTDNFVAAVEAGLLYRYLHQNFEVFADERDRTAMGYLNFLFHALTDKLPAEKRGYGFAGIDEIQKRLECAVKGLSKSEG